MVLLSVMETLSIFTAQQLFYTCPGCLSSPETPKLLIAPVNVNIKAQHKLIII